MGTPWPRASTFSRLLEYGLCLRLQQQYRCALKDPKLRPIASVVVNRNVTTALRVYVEEGLLALLAIETHEHASAQIRSDERAAFVTFCIESDNARHGTVSWNPPALDDWIRHRRADPHPLDALCIHYCDLPNAQVVKNR